MYSQHKQGKTYHMDSKTIILPYSVFSGMAIKISEFNNLTSHMELWDTRGDKQTSSSAHDWKYTYFVVDYNTNLYT